jgi:RNA polymerase sigma-70 factor (ECF subfamily)
LSDRIFEEGQGRWPQIRLERARLYELLAASVPVSQDEGPPLQAADLYLACACLAADPAALRVFDEHILEKARSALRKLAPGDAADEVLQAVRESLLMSHHGRPAKLCQYNGRGSLIHWVRAVAVRTALNLRRGSKPRGNIVDEAEAEALASASLGPELAFVRAQHRGDFRAAFALALAGLPAREKAVLQLTVIEGMSTTEVAKSYRADSSTVRRWLISAREQLLRETRRHLSRKLSLTPSEFDSLVAALKSDLDVSLERLLNS